MPHTSCPSPSKHCIACTEIAACAQLGGRLGVGVGPGNRCSAVLLAGQLAAALAVASPEAVGGHARLMRALLQLLQVRS